MNRKSRDIWENHEIPEESLFSNENKTDYFIKLLLSRSSNSLLPPPAYFSTERITLLLRYFTQ
jgi:hypothetical protein